MSKLDKAEILLREAKEDLKHECYNKAVSASYFAVRLFVESFLPGLMTRRDDKVANALFREIERRTGREKAEEIKSNYLFLFDQRKKADHRADIFGKEAEEIVAMAERLMREIEEILR